jgi:hypothetical protein
VSWKRKDLREFDRLVAMAKSSGQMTRIVGRIKWREFEKRFTKDELKEMWEKIKQRQRRDG